MIVIGVDTHKWSHTLVALEPATGVTRGELTIPASDDGTLEALRFASELDNERVWAIEDCRHVSGGDEHDVGPYAGRLAQHVSAPRDAVGNPRRL